MKPIEPSVTNLLYGCTEKGAAKQYLKARYKKSPEDKYLYINVLLLLNSYFTPRKNNYYNNIFFYYQIKFTLKTSYSCHWYVIVNAQVLLLV